MTFQRGLGSYKDKAERMERVAADEAALAVLADEAAAWRVARRALRLCKADLTTQMVREFPELQGRMGANYANASEGSSVATAIAHHYEVEPVSVADRISSLAVLNTSLVDKLDTLIGYFRIGSIPTGSADPFGLRRAAQGVVRALLQAPPGSVKLTRLSNRLNEEFARQTGETGNADALPRLGDFLVERLRHALQANGHNARAVDAVLSARERASLSTGTNQALDNATLVENDVTETEALIAQQPADFAALAESFKRAKNIVADAETGDVNESLLSEAAERDLLAAIQKAESSPASDPAARLRAVAGLRGEVDTFFKSVMVMAEDPALKANRLALLSRLLNLVYEVADLSKLASPAGEKAVSS